MSLINDMLQDLERRRRAGPEGAGRAIAGLGAAVVGPDAAGRARRRERVLVMVLAAVAGFALAGLPGPPGSDPVQTAGALAGPPVAGEPAPARGADPVSPPRAVRAALAALPVDPGLRLSRDLEHVPRATVAAPPEAEPAPAPVPTVEAFVALLAAAPPEAHRPAPEPAAPVVHKSPVAPTPRERAEARFREAVALLRAGREHEADARLAEALAVWPGHAKAREVLAARHLGAGRLDEAEALLRAGLARDPGQPGLARLQARVLAERDDLDGALAVLSGARAGAGADPTFHAFHGALLQRAGRHGEAVEAFRAALLLRPEAAAWWTGLGISLEATGEGEEARRAYQRARSGPLPPAVDAFVAARLDALSQ